MAGRPRKLTTNSPFWDASNMKRYIVETIPPLRRGRPPKLENMSVLELSRLQNSVQLTMHWKREEEIEKLRTRVTAMVKDAGFDVKDIIR